MFNWLRGELEAITSVGDLQQWGDDNGALIATFRADWQKALRFRYTEKLAELRQPAAAKAEVPAVVRRVRNVAPEYVVPPPSRDLKAGGIAERAIEARQFKHRSPGPSQPFLATREGPRSLPPIDDAAGALNRLLHPMNDELPDHSAHGGINEVSADRISLLVPLQHSDALPGIEGDVVVDRGAAPTGFYAIFGENSFSNDYINLPGRWATGAKVVAVPAWSWPGLSRPSR